MKISTKGRYGLRAMIDLATHADNGRPVYLSDIAKRQELSTKYLEQIFATLNTAALVKTIRGRKGGYLLNRAPKEITLREIVATLEGPCILVDCVADQNVCPKTGSCAARDIWTLLGSKIDELLTGFTLADLVTMQKEKAEDGTSMYHI